jgi:hypothetical protein
VAALVNSTTTPINPAEEGNNRAGLCERESDAIRVLVVAIFNRQNFHLPRGKQEEKQDKERV